MIEDSEIEKLLLPRFMNYVRYCTESSRNVPETPSTAGQWDLARALCEELSALGLKDVTLTNHCYVIARLPPSPGKENAPSVGFLAHIDTASDVSGKDVQPRLVPNYNGEKIELAGGLFLDPAKEPDLAAQKGKTIIHSDGTTLLGADNKAGIAIILTAMEYFLRNPDIPRGKIRIAFTPDEEIGRGMSKFPKEKAKSIFCYTLDGDGEGTIEMECFNAYSATVNIKGNVIHLGSARGKLVNAVKLASEFVQMLPSQESPEATDGRYGYYCAVNISGNLGEAKVELLLRDFDKTNMEKRIKAVESAAKTLETLYPGSSVNVSFTRQYGNMADLITKNIAVYPLRYCCHISNS